MAAVVCLMLLLPDEPLTEIIIHSIKDVVVFHFLNLRNKIYDTFEDQERPGGRWMTAPQ
jgi:hypothetical protein